MRITSILAAAFALAATLSAQPATPPTTTSTLAWPPITELAQYLNLTQSQVTSLQNIVQQAAQAQQQISDQIAQKNQALQTLLQSANPNPTTVGQTMIDIQNLQKQLTPTTEPYHTQALAVLTSSQTTLLANLNTALQLETPACEAVSVNLLVVPSSVSILGTVAILGPITACPLLPGIAVPAPVGPVTTLPGGVAPSLPPPGQ